MRRTPESISAIFFDIVQKNVETDRQIFNKKTIILIDEREILVYTIHETR